MLGFPLLLIPFAIYNMIAFITPMDWATTPYTFPLKSGLQWGPSVSDGFLVFSLLMLMCEFIKATNHGKSIVEHFLSIVLAGAAAAEFVMVKEAGNSIFMLFTAICFVDLFAGFAASLRRARRSSVPPADIPVTQPVTHAPITRVDPPPPRAEPVRVEPSPHIEPAPAVAPARTEPVVKIDPVQKIEP